MKRRRSSRSCVPIFLVSAVLTALLFLVPLALTRNGAMRQGTHGAEEPSPSTQTEGETVPEGGQEASAGASEHSPAPDSAALETGTPPERTAGERDRAVILRVLDGGNVREMDLARYLSGVLRGEMPASFELEALKAQAVAARTYTLRMILDGGKHGGDADICTDSTHCQAYRSEEAAREGWGSQADACEAKIEEAVAATDGETILYGGEPILAVFHSSSPGLTQNVAQVWGGEKPYLLAVPSPETADKVPNYYSRQEFTAAQFREKIYAAFPQADLSGGMDGWVQEEERNTARTVERVRVGGVSMRGAQLRTALGLRSACFTWEVQDGKLVFYVTAHGHGVGMSQYGANLMAKDGADYREILTHYYTGVTVGYYGDAGQGW